MGEYLRNEAQGRQSQSGLPGECRAVYKDGGSWQAVCPDLQNEQPTANKMTTVMVSGIPPLFCTESIKEKVDNTGSYGKYRGKYDYIYLPPNVENKKTGNCMGYGFINFESAVDACEFMNDWPRTELSKNSKKPRSANWASRRQGFDHNLRFHQMQPEAAMYACGKLSYKDTSPQFLLQGQWHIMVKGQPVL